MQFADLYHQTLLYIIINIIMSERSSL